MILKKNGLTPNDVRMISLQTTNNVYLTLDTKQITAGMLSVPLDIKAKLAGFKVLASAADYTTAYQGGIATTTKKIAEMPEVTERLLTGYIQSLRGLKANREATIDAIVKHFEKIDRPLAAASYEQVAPAVSRTPSSSDRRDRERAAYLEPELTGKEGRGPSRADDGPGAASARAQAAAAEIRFKRRRGLCREENSAVSRCNTA